MGIIVIVVYKNGTQKVRSIERYYFYKLLGYPFPPHTPATTFAARMPYKSR